VSADPAAPAPTGRRSGIARSIGAEVALTLAVLCLVLAPPAVWGRNLVLDTDRYVQTLVPLGASAVSR
jgi:hypothetical protein